MINTNKVNTQFSDEDLKTWTKEEVDTYKEYFYGIKFLQNLASPDRPYAKDFTRYEDPDLDTSLSELVEDPVGRIRVDFANPHILEDTNDFRPAAVHFEKHGKYTLLMPSRNPYSDYVKFWDQEVQRCWYGYTRESDGDWITGYHYFYLNYVRILQAKKSVGSKKALRVYDFPKFYDGDYWFFHYLDRARSYGKHTTTLKKRGAGYSYKGGAKLARNFILGASAQENYSVSSFAVANEKEYLTKDGVLNKFISIVDWCGGSTPFPRRKELKDSWNLMHWIMGYKDPNLGIERGTKNEVIGVTLKNDPERARGKRGVLIEWEEFGKFPNALKAWNIGRPSVESDEFAFGLMNAYGTGGTEGAAFEGLRELFYNPYGYNVMPLENVYDKNTKPGSVCAFFHATYLNSENRMDEHGNSDVTASLLDIVKQRITIKYNSRDPSTLAQIMAEKPVTPQEAILQTGGNIFPVPDIISYLEDCRVNEARFTAHHLVGDLVLVSDSEVKFEPNPNKYPIRRHNADATNTEGAIEIFVLPEKNKDNIVEPYRYIAGIDPVDNDYIATGSLASIFIFDTFTDQIVAEYTGRTQIAEDFYEICRRLLIFYNAQANYENNIKGLFGYFNNLNCLYLLCDTPQYLRDIEEVKNTLYGNRAKGTRTTTGVIEQGKRLQRSWMLSPYEYIDGEGNETKTILLRTIRSLGYLEEAQQYNPEGNFDRVSAMDMVMILRQDRKKITNKRKEDQDLGYIEVDQFIADNFDNKFLTREGAQEEVRLPKSLFKNSPV